jgi:hypothetical protein
MTDSEFKGILLKFRSEPAGDLPFAPCIESLIDDEYCQHMSRMLEGEDKHWERKKAVPDLSQVLPSETGLYMFVWQPKFTLRVAPERNLALQWVLYVGKAGGTTGGGNIKNRYHSEYSKYVGRDPSILWEKQNATKREQFLARYLTLQPLEFWFLTVSNVNEIELMERKLIKLLRPPLNIQHGVRLRAGKPEKVV